MTQQPHDAYADLAPSVGDRLRIARERRAKLSQGDFADLINVSRGSGVDVEWLETGQAPVQPEPDGGLSVESLRARRYSKPQPSDPKVMGLLTWSAAA